MQKQAKICYKNLSEEEKTNKTENMEQINTKVCRKKKRKLKEQGKI